jgi:hypothetical protein
MADETVGSTAKGREHKHDIRGAADSESNEDRVNRYFEDHEDPADNEVEQLLSVVKAVPPGGLFH